MTSMFSLLLTIQSNVDIYILLLSIVIPFFIIISHNKKEQQPSDSKEGTNRSDKEKEYEKKLKDYISGVDEEVIFTKNKSRSIYNKIVAKIYTRSRYANPPSNKLFGFIGRVVGMFSRKRYQFEKFKNKKRKAWFYYNFTNRDFYRLFIDKVVVVSNKKRKKLGKGEVNFNNILIRRKKFSNLFTLMNEQIGNKVSIKQKKIHIDNRTNFRFVHLYRNLYLPYLKRIYDRVFNWPTETTFKSLKYLPNGSFFFQGISYNSMLGAPFFFPTRLKRIAFSYNYPSRHLIQRSSKGKEFEIELIGKSMWQFLSKSVLKDPKDTSFKGDRWYFNKKTKVWMHTLHYLYTLNRVKFYKQRQIKQRSRNIASIRQMIKGRKRKKIRAYPKTHRLTPYFYVNHYLSQFYKIHKKTLFKSLEMNYSKYPFYKASIRYFSHDFSSILKKFTKKQRKRYMAAKNFLTGKKLFQGPTFFSDINIMKNKAMHRFPGERIVGKVEKKRRYFFGSQRKFKRQVYRLLSKWLLNSLSSKQELKEGYTLSGKWAINRLDLSMATYALTNPNEFEKLFKKELDYMKNKRKTYSRFLIRDPFGIQRVGSAFFYFLGYFNPILTRKLSDSSHIESNRYEQVREGYYPKQKGRSTKSTRVRKILASRPHRRRIKMRKRKHPLNPSIKSKYNYKGFSLWNHINLYNSFIKAYMLSTLSKLDNKNTSQTPFTLLYRTSSKAAMHFKTLYGYLFKAEQLRPYKKAISHLARRNSKMYKLLQTPKKIYGSSNAGSKKRHYLSLRRKSRIKYTYDVYDTFKRYLKLKLQNKLPKGVTSLSDWYSYINTLVTSTKKGNTISPRFFYLPFHLKAFFIRSKFRTYKTRKGIKGLRYSNMVVRSKSFSRYLKRRYKVLHPKRKSIRRASKISLRPNQTRHSLLYNHYLLIKELIAQHIKSPQNYTFYKSVNYLVRPIMTRFFTLPHKLLVVTGLKKIHSNFKDYITPIFTSNTYLFFSTQLVEFVISYVTTKLLHSIAFLLSKLVQYGGHLFYVIYIKMLLLILVNCYFLLTLPGVPLLLKVVQNIVWNYLTKSVYFKMISILDTFVSTLVYHVFIELKLIVGYIFKINSFFIKCVIFIGLTPLMSFLRDILLLILYTCSVLQRIFNFCFYIISLYFTHPISIVYISLYKMIHQIKTFVANYQFNNYILECYEYVFFKTNKASWIEYRLMGFFYIILSKFKPRGYRYYFLYSVFSLPIRRFTERTIKEVMLDIEHFFVGYYARVFHWMIRPNLILETVMETCYSYIWSAFFGRWALDGYVHRFRSLYLFNLDEALATALTYILLSPMLVVNLLLEVKPWTYRFLYREIVLNLYVVTGYILGFPVYLVFDLLWRTERYNLGIYQLFISILMYIYNVALYLFIFSQQFLIILYTLLPAYKVVLYEFLLSYEPIRLIRGLAYTINMHEEILTAYAAILKTLFALFSTYIFFSRLPRFFFTLYRAVNLNLKSTASPFYLDANIDLKMYNFFPLPIEMKYLKDIYNNLIKKHYFYFSTERILWFMKKKPSYYKLYYKDQVSPRANPYILFHIRKHSNTLYKYGDTRNIIKLKTKWFASMYPFDKQNDWWKQHERYKYTFYHRYISWTQRRKLLNLSPPLPPARRSHKMGSIKYKQMCRQVLGLPELKPKTANDRLEDKLRSDKLTKHLPRVIRLYLLRHAKFVDNNIKNNPIYKLSHKYQIANKISTTLASIIVTIIESFTVIYFFNLALIGFILSFVVHLLCPPFILRYLRDNYVTFASAEYWVDYNAQANIRVFKSILFLLKSFLTDMFNIFLVYLFSIPWRFLKFFIFVSNILFTMYRDLHDVVNHMYDPDTLNKVKSPILHGIGVWLRIIKYRITKKGYHPLYEHQKTWNFKFTQDYIFNFKIKPNNLKSFLHYQWNYDRKKDYKKGVSQQDYVTFDELKGDKEV